MKTKSFLSRLLIVFVLVMSFVPIYGTSNETVIFPSSEFVPGWKTDGSMREFNRNGLYGHINGGSELFLEMGFEVLKLQKYTNTGDTEEITLETYKMDSPEAALGIYLLKCGPETPVPGVTQGIRHTGDSHQLMILNGAYYILVNSYSGNESLLPVMTQLANKLIEKIPNSQPSDLFSLLPKENKVPGTEVIFRGPYSLEAIFTFGEGDILLLNNKIFGVSAQYTVANSAQPTGASPEVYNHLLIRYPDINNSQKAFSHLKANLDSYIQVLNMDKNQLTFKDYRGKFGIVQLKEDIINIKVNLVTLD